MKHSVFGFLMVPLIIQSAFAMDTVMLIQLRQNQIEKLQATRAAKYAELLECERTNERFTIAGTSAISVASIGFAINDKLQEKLAKFNNSFGTARSGNGWTDAQKNTAMCDELREAEPDLYAECLEMMK